MEYVLCGCLEWERPRLGHFEGDARVIRPSSAESEGNVSKPLALYCKKAYILIKSTRTPAPCFAALP